LPKQLNFKELDPKSALTILPFALSTPIDLCDCTAGGIIFGRKAYNMTCAIGENGAYIETDCPQTLTGRQYYPPLGEDTENALKELLSHAKAKGDEKVTVTGMPEEITRSFCITYNAEAVPIRGWEDYFYSAPSLAELRGSSYHGQRSNINKFFRVHGMHSFMPITAENIQVVKALSEKILVLQPHCDATGRADAGFCRDLIDSFFDFSCIGGILYSEETPIGFAVGTVKNRVLYIHIMKALRDYDGAWNLLNREFVRENLALCDFVNMEEDLGDQGLRKMKESYKPIKLLQKYAVTFNTAGF